MRITIIGPVFPYRGGIAHHTTLLARSIEESGHDVQLISFRRQYPTLLYPGQSDKDPSSNPLEVRALFSLDPFYPWTWTISISNIVSFSPEAVIIPWWTTFWSPAFWFLAYSLRKRNIIVIFLIHNVVPHESKPWDKWLSCQVLRYGNSFVVQSLHEQKQLVKLLPGRRLFICPHPVYDFFSRSAITKAKARKLLGVDADKLILLFFGIVRPYKGLKILVESVANLIAAGTDLHLLVAGEFWEDKTPYLRQIHKLGLDKVITIDDRYIPNEEVATSFTAADIFIAPYISGTQSGAVNIALGFGLPIVASDKAFGGFFVERPNIRVVSQLDKDNLTAALKNLIANMKVFPRPASDQSTKSWKRLVDVIEEAVHKDSQNKTTRA
jgi:glycosyltransferase involved in cell wall biosynthesis